MKQVKKTLSKKLFEATYMASTPEDIKKLKSSGVVTPSDTIKFSTKNNSTTNPSTTQPSSQNSAPSPTHIYENEKDNGIHVEYLSDIKDEKPFEIHGDKFEYIWAKYPDGKREVGVWLFGKDRAVSLDWFKNNVLEKPSANEESTKNNPWAICTNSVGREDKAKYERCVMDVKKQRGIKEDNATKDLTKNIDGNKEQAADKKLQIKFDLLTKLINLFNSAQKSGTLETHKKMAFKALIKNAKLPEDVANDYIEQALARIDKNDIKQKPITVRSKKNNLFHYDILFDNDGKVSEINNEWDVTLPVWIGQHYKDVITNLNDHISKKRQDFYIEKDETIKEDDQTVQVDGVNIPKLQQDVKILVDKLDTILKPYVAKIDKPIEKAEFIAAIAEKIGVPREKLSSIIQSLRTISNTTNTNTTTNTSTTVTENNKQKITKSKLIETVSRVIKPKVIKTIKVKDITK